MNKLKFPIFCLLIIFAFLSCTKDPVTVIGSGALNLELMWDGSGVSGDENPSVMPVNDKLSERGLLSPSSDKLLGKKNNNLSSDRDSSNPPPAKTAPDLSDIFGGTGSNYAKAGELPEYINHLIIVVSGSGEEFRYVVNTSEQRPINFGSVPTGSAMSVQVIASDVSTGEYYFFAGTANNVNIAENVTTDVQIEMDRNNNAPTAPEYTGPLNNAINVSRNALFTWNRALDHDPWDNENEEPNGETFNGTYNFYLGTSEATIQLLGEGITDTNFQTTVMLEQDTQYYWRVDANDGEAQTSGEVWTFNTGDSTNGPPVQPFNPNPADGATGIGLTPILDWECSDPEGDPILYDVNFGTESDDLELIADGISESTFAISDSLEYYTTYYWQVIASDNYSNVTPGPIWSFQTVGVSAGGVWVTTTDINTGNGYVIKFDMQGEKILELSTDDVNMRLPGSLAHDPTDNSVWVAFRGRFGALETNLPGIAKISSSGSDVTTYAASSESEITDITVDTNGYGYYVDHRPGGGQVIKLSPTMQYMDYVDFSSSFSIDCYSNGGTDSLWVVPKRNSYIARKYDTDFSEPPGLSQHLFNNANYMDIDDELGLVWVAETEGGSLNEGCVVKFDANDGTTLFTITGVDYPIACAVDINGSSHSVWVTSDAGSGYLRKFSSYGSLLESATLSNAYYAVDVNPVDHSVWVTSNSPSGARLHKFSPEAVEVMIPIDLDYNYAFGVVVVPE